FQDTLLTASYDLSLHDALPICLDRFGLTDEDAEQLRALQVLRGKLDGQSVSLPWLEQINLLVLDGFFDFTPVQGEILKNLIPSIDRKSTRLNSSHQIISYAVFC